MKKSLKGLMTITMVLALTIALTGCGKDETDNKKNNNQSSNGEYHGNTEGSKDLKNVSNSNYKDVSKNVFGIKLKDTSGWVIKKAESLNGVNDLSLNYTVENGEDVKTILEYYYNECKSVSKDGIYEIEVNYDNYSVGKGTKFDNFESYYKTITNIGTLYQGKWIYDNNGKGVQIAISINETYATISLVLLS